MPVRYELARRLPIIRCYYQGTKSHPVRRTLAKIEEDANTITGYELRCGNEVRELKDAPVKTYRKDKIARIRDLDARRPIRREAIKRKKSQSVSTLSRHDLENLVVEGA